MITNWLCLHVRNPTYNSTNSIPTLVGPSIWLEGAIMVINQTVFMRLALTPPKLNSLDEIWLLVTGV